MDAQNYAAIVVPMDQASRQFADFRRRHIKTPAVALPAHITLIPRFCDPDAITGEVITRLCAVLSDQTAFDVTLDRMLLFESARVLYLSPKPIEPLSDLARRLESVHGQAKLALDLIFHVTLAHRPADLAAAEIEFRSTNYASLPIVERADRAELYAKRQGVWQLRHVFPFLGCSRRPCLGNIRVREVIALE